MRAWRWWLANAGAFTLVCLFAPVLAQGRGLTWLGVVAAVVGFASVVQGLRNLWFASRTKAVLLAVVTPILLMASVLYGGHADWTVWLLALPTVVATIVEFAVRRRRGAPEPPTPTVEAVAPTPARRGRGCLVWLGVGVALVAFSVWSLRAPSRNAAAFHAELRLGMTLGEVAIAAWPHGRYLVWVRTAQGEAPAILISSGRAQVGSESAEGEVAVRRVLDQAAVDLKVQTVGFVFLTSAPARSSVVVHFGPDGRVTAIDRPVSQAN